MDSAAPHLVASTIVRPRPQRPSSLLVNRTTLEFDAFYRREFASMVSLAYTISDDYQTAEDLAQEALSRAHHHWPKISGYDRPGAWLRRVTINLALSRTQRAKREVLALRRKLSREPTATTGGLDDDLVDRDVWAAVRLLPPRQRAVIALFYQEDRTTRDIAEILDCSVSTATSHLNQARANLAKQLDAEEAK